MHRVYAIAINTFREAVRDRVLYGVLSAGTAVLLFSLALGELSLNQEKRVVMDIGLASISLFSVVVAIFLGSSHLYKEIERKTLYVILPKPIFRHEFLLGKYFGIVATVGVFVALMGSIHVWVMALQADAPIAYVIATPVLCVAALGLIVWRARDATTALVPWSLGVLALTSFLYHTTKAEVTPVLAALALTVGEALTLTAVALVFSSFSTPFLTALLTFGVWLVGRSADEMVTMKSKLISSEMRALLRGIAEVVPNFNLFVPGRYTLESFAPDYGGAWTYVGTSLAYACIYSAVLLVFASLIFRRRDFL